MRHAAQDENIKLKADYDALKTENLNLYSDLNSMGDSIKTLINQRDHAIKMLEEKLKATMKLVDYFASTRNPNIYTAIGIASDIRTELKGGSDD